MTEEIMIDGELSCNNCLEKTRCKQQQEVKVQRIDAILSYIANEDNEKYIAELKNEIPAITRCDVVLEKQLKRLEQENKNLKKQIESQKGLITVGGKQQYEYLQKIDELEQENKELKTWLESKEKQLKHLIEYDRNKKDQIKTLKFMLFEEKEIPKDKFTMMYRIAQNERRTRSHRDLCTNITKKYRSALEEIRAMINHPDYRGLLNKIEDRINEVLK